jgi:hypothetical protein
MCSPRAFSRDLAISASLFRRSWGVSPCGIASPLTESHMSRENRVTITMPCSMKLRSWPPLPSVLATNARGTLAPISGTSYSRRSMNAWRMSLDSGGEPLHQSALASSRIPRAGRDLVYSARDSCTSWCATRSQPGYAVPLPSSTPIATRNKSCPCFFIGIPPCTDLYIRTTARAGCKHCPARTEPPASGGERWRRAPSPMPALSNSMK